MTLLRTLRKRFYKLVCLPKTEIFYVFYGLINLKIATAIFRHCEVVFGVCTSPFILAAMIELHLNTILENITNGLPIDFTGGNIVKFIDSFNSVNSVDQLNSFMSGAKRAMESAKFDLRG